MSSYNPESPGSQLPPNTGPPGTVPVSNGSNANNNNKNLSHVPCKFFKQGVCQAGNSCPFSHNLEGTLAADRLPCKYFQKGNCKFGLKCALAHFLPDGTRVNSKSLMSSTGSKGHSHGQNYNSNYSHHNHGFNNNSHLYDNNTVPTNPHHNNGNGLFSGSAPGFNGNQNASHPATHSRNPSFSQNNPTSSANGSALHSRGSSSSNNFGPTNALPSNYSSGSLTQFYAGAGGNPQSSSGVNGNNNGNALAGSRRLSSSSPQAIDISANSFTGAGTSAGATGGGPFSPTNSNNIVRYLNINPQNNSEASTANKSNHAQLDTASSSLSSHANSIFSNAFSGGPPRSTATDGTNQSISLSVGANHGGSQQQTLFRSYSTNTSPTTFTGSSPQSNYYIHGNFNSYGNAQNTSISPTGTSLRYKVSQPFSSSRIPPTLTSPTSYHYNNNNNSSLNNPNSSNYDSAIVDDDDELGNDDNGFYEEDYVPGSLGDLILTPQELQRRDSRSQSGTLLVRPQLNSILSSSSTASAAAGIIERTHNDHSAVLKDDKEHTDKIPSSHDDVFLME